MNEITITLDFAKSTPGTHVYRGPKDCAIPTLYVKRAAFNRGPPPAQTTVIVEVATFPRTRATRPLD